jgi:hypothetical protein
MKHWGHGVILAVLALAAIQYATPGRAEGTDSDWLMVTSNRFSLAVDYPAALFSDPLMSYGEGDTVWFGPNKDAATLMISAILAGDQTPYERACASGCPNTVSTDDKPAIGAVAGHIDDKIYYSKCLLAEGLERDSPKEIHCFHIIYKASDRSTYEPIVAHMSATLK